FTGLRCLAPQRLRIPGIGEVCAVPGGEEGRASFHGKDYAFHKSMSKNLWKETIFKPAAEELKNHAAYVAKVGTAHIDELFLSAFGMRKGVGRFRSQRKQASQYVKDHGQTGSSGGKTEKLKVIMRQDLYSNHPAVTKTGMRESFGGLENDSDDEDDDDSEKEGGEGGEVEDAPMNQELWGDLSRHMEDRGDSAANLTVMEEGDDCSALEDEAEDGPPADFGDAGGDCGHDGDSPPEGDGSNDQGGAAGGVLAPPAARVRTDQPILFRGLSKETQEAIEKAEREDKEKAEREAEELGRI
ncbi:unnamed protein product, partial [Ectocarpus sp. 6 AP-2014]